MLMMKKVFGFDICVYFAKQSIHKYHKHLSLVHYQNVVVVVLLLQPHTDQDQLASAL